MSTQIENRSYQADVIQGVRRSVGAGNKKILLQAGTGSGKTVIAGQIIKRAIEKGSGVLFLAHRRELVSQCSRKLDDIDVAHGIILAGERPDHRHLVQVGSIQTLEARYLKKQDDLFEVPLPKVDLCVYDECHIGLEGQARVMKVFPDAIFLGLTATPVRSDGRGLGLLYQDMVCAPSIGELTEQGYLVPVKYFAPSAPDIKGVKVLAGDYNEKQLGERMDKEGLIGDVVKHYQSICPEKKFIVFAPTVANSIHMAEQFNAAGIPTAHLDGETPLEERKVILNDLKTGRIQGICNCMVLSEGFDEPSVETIILYRPTKSVALYLQMSGRMLRPFCRKCKRYTPWTAAACVHCGSDDVKREAILIDHAGAVLEHGMLDEFVDWALDPNGTIQERQKVRKKKERKPLVCGSCKTVFKKGRHCPRCGWSQPKKERVGEAADVAEGSLQAIDAGQKLKKPKYSHEDKMRWLSEFKGYAEEKGKSDGYVTAMYKNKFNEWAPRNAVVEPKAPGFEVRSYIKSRNIAYAKSKKTPGASA